MIPASPCSFAQVMSATACSTSPKDTDAMPARRPGVAAQNSDSHRLKISEAWRASARSGGAAASTNGMAWNGSPFENSTSPTTPALSRSRTRLSESHWESDPSSGFRLPSSNGSASMARTHSS